MQSQRNISWRKLDITEVAVRALEAQLIQKVPRRPYLLLNSKTQLFGLPDILRDVVHSLQDLCRRFAFVEISIHA